MANFTSLISQLEQERSRLTAQLERLNTALSALNGTGTNSGSRKGRLSAAGRARIAVAARARWAKAKGKVVSIARRKRTLSAAAIARIRAAQRARWAKWRKQQKST